MIRAIAHKTITYILFISLAMMTFGVANAAAPPNIVTYQGRLLNSNGVPASDASLSMKFFLYSASSGGSCLWSNDSGDCHTNTPASVVARSVTLSSGLFTENLGDTGSSYAAIADSVFGDNTSVYLEVEIAGETLSPRRQLTAAPYALNAQRLDGIDSTGFLASTGDTGTGAFDFSGATFSGASPIVLEGATANDFETTFAVTDPTADRTITFQNASGTVAFTSDVSSQWEDGTNGIFEDDSNVIIGVDAAFTYASGANSDLRVADELEAIGDVYFGVDLVVGASTSSTETLTNSAFALGGDDLFVAGLLGVEGSVYSDAGFDVSGTTTLSSGAITTTGSTDLLLTIAGGDLTFGQSTTIGDGSQAIAINTSNWDISTTGDLTNIGGITMDGNLSTSGDVAINGDDLTSDGNLTINATGYTRIGDTATPGAANSDDSLFVEGEFEVDSSSVFDGTALFNGSATFDGSVLPANAGDEALGSTSFEWDGIYIGDDGVGLEWGADQDFFSTYNSTDQLLTFGTSGGSSADIDYGMFTFAIEADNGTVTANQEVFEIGRQAQDDSGANWVELLALDEDGDLTIAGTAAVAGITCTDCLDFTEFADSMTLDASTSIALGGDAGFAFQNNGTGSVYANLVGTGDFQVQDNGATVFRVDSDGVTRLSQTTSSEALVISHTGNANAIDLSSSVTTSTALELDADSLTTGMGLELSSDSGNLTSGQVMRVEHAGVYTADNTLSGAMVNFDRNIEIDSAGQTLTVLGPVLRVANQATRTSGTLNNQGDILQVLQQDTSGTNRVIKIDNDGTGEGLYVDQDGNGIAISIDSESTSTNVVSIDGSQTTTGTILQVTGGDFTDDTGLAMVIDVTETTETANIVMIQTDYTSSNNNVFRIEADGEVFSDVGFTAGAFSTNYLDGSLTTTSNYSVEATGYVRIGDNGTPGAANSDDSLYVEGEFEVDSSSVFDGTVAVNSTLTADDFVCTSGDCLDFTDFADSMTLDASTVITGAADRVLSFNRTLTDQASENGLLLSVTASNGNSNPNTGQVGLAIENRESSDGLGAGILILNSDANDYMEAGIALNDGINSNGFAYGIDFQSADITNDLRLQSGMRITNANSGSATFDFQNDGGSIFQIHSSGSGVGDRTELYVDSEDNTDLAHLFNLESDAVANDSKVFQVLHDGTINSLLGTGARVSFDASTVQSTAQEGIFDLNVRAGNAAVDAMNINLNAAGAISAGTDLTAIDIDLVANDVDADLFGIKITADSAVGAAGSYEAGVSVETTNLTVDVVPDAFRVLAGGDGSIQDGFDASDAQVVNAVNAGTNFVLFDGQRIFSSSSSILTFEDTDGNDLMTLLDNSNEGDLTVTGDIVADDFTCTNGDCLDFTEFADSMSLDASTTIGLAGDQELLFDNNGIGNVAVDLRSTGDFIVKDNGGDFFTVTDDRGISFASNRTTTDAFDLTLNDLTTGTGIDVNVNGLTEGNGIGISSSGAITSGNLLDLDHAATYNQGGTTSLSGSGIRFNRGITNAGAGTTNITGPAMTIASNGTQTSGTLTDNSNILLLQQNYTGAIGHALQVLNAGTGSGMFLDQNGNGTSIQIDSEATSATTVALKVANTSGGIVEIQHDSPTTLTGQTAGVNIDFNVNTTGGSGAHTSLFRAVTPDLTASGTTTTNIFAFDVSTPGLLDTTDANTTTIDWSGLRVMMPDIDTGNAADTVKSRGIQIVPGSVTNGAGTETQIGLSMGGSTLAFDNDEDSVIFSDIDDLLKVNIGDSATSVLLIQDPQPADDASSANVPVLEINLDAPEDSTGTNIHSALSVDLDVGNSTGGSNTIMGIAFDPIVGDADVSNVHAISIGSLAGSSANNEVAVDIAAGWDAVMRFNDTNNRIWVNDGGMLNIEDPSGNNMMVLADVSTSNNHVISTDADTLFTIDSGSDLNVDLSTGTNQMLRIQPDGSGDTVFDIDSNTNVRFEASTAPGQDMVVISNSGNPTTTTGANALDITHAATNADSSAMSITPGFTGGATDGLVYQGLLIETFSPTNGAGTDTVAGIEIQSIVDPGSTINSHALELGGNWDSNIFFNDESTVISLVNTGSITWRDNAGTPNDLMSLTDIGIAARLNINNIQSYNDAELDLTAGGATSSSGNPGGTVDINAGAGDGAGNGGNVGIDAGPGGATGNGGGVQVAAGNGGATSGDGGSIRIIAGDATGGGIEGDIEIQSGGAPTALSLDGGDIGITTDDDFFVSADDDVRFSVTSASAQISLFDDTVTKTIDIAGVNQNAADTINIATEGTTADTILIGNTNATTTVEIRGGNDWTVNPNGQFTIDLSNGASSTEAVCGTVGTENSSFSMLDDCTTSVNADYAERYPSADNVDYGHIVVPGDKIVYTEDDSVGRQEIRQAVLSSETYQGPVIGIASNNYGDFTSAGGNVAEEDNPIPIALVGRVPVKVVAENGAIDVGDFLTTSSTPGHAMRATKMGRVIGMALEDWNGEKDTVMVQVINSWYMGDIIGEDGTTTVSTNNVIVTQMGEANEDEETFDSYGLSLRGSAWDGSEAQVVEMAMQNIVEDEDNYRLSISSGAETEVAYITNEGTMRIAGDMVIGGNLYPSDRGTPQTEKYIYYDGSEGAGGDFMRTNAKGWSTGSYDFAEMFPSTEELEPGDVVMFSGTGEYVRRSASAQEESLAGIVSTRPGFLAGENVEGAHPIALAGRVPTRITLENGDIAVGDPLTSSSTAGAAMKATESGSIIGYALESYSGSGDDKILVYVNVGYWGGGETPAAPGTDNRASEFASSGTQNFTALNMNGSIAMNSHSITNIGSLSGMGETWSINSNGTIKTEGLLKTEITTLTNKKVETIAVTSPEAIITLSGTATLENGQAEVRFEQVAPDFNDVINVNEPIRVVVTPSGPVSLYVSEKDQNHFAVQRFAGDTDVEFDWVVTAYRKDFGPTEVEEEDMEADVEVDQVSSEEDSPEDEISEQSAQEPLEEEEVPESEGDQVESETSEEPAEEESEDVADEVVEQTEETADEEEPASPESSELTQVDSASETDEGGEPAETPSENDETS